MLGRDTYEAFTREIGDTHLLNGMIALVRPHASMPPGVFPSLRPHALTHRPAHPPTQTIFARTADVERGAVQVARSAMGKLHSGMKLGPVRAPNKGMVGISLRIHDGALRGAVRWCCCGDASRPNPNLT